MNAIKKENEINGFNHLDNEIPIEVSAELTKKKNWLKRLFKFLFQKESDLNYEEWKSIELKHRHPLHDVDESWVINHRWSL